MLRTDGLYSIYRVQTKSPSGDWFYPSFDWYGTPLEEMRTYRGIYFDPITSGGVRGFGANGQCWQETGVHGTFHADVGRAAVTWMRKRHPTREWRLVRVAIEQKTTPVNFRMKRKPQK